DRPGCGREGDAVTFTVGGRPANEKARWHASPPPVPDEMKPGIRVYGVASTELDMVAGPPFAAFSGEVTLPGGDPVPGPTGPLLAYVGSALCGKVEGLNLGMDFWSLVVPPAALKAGCGREGAIIRFAVGDRPILETVAWVPGFHKLRLTASSPALPAGGNAGLAAPGGLPEGQLVLGVGIGLLATSLGLWLLTRRYS
ncbi:MAG TPA: hypothetical protein VJM69_05410, partial [Dehalococcoidia bacterium]|nr:hypothetical protein [Dehalococcoidia bacterium]